MNQKKMEKALASAKYLYNDRDIPKTMIDQEVLRLLQCVCEAALEGESKVEIEKVHQAVSAAMLERVQGLLPPRQMTPEELEDIVRRNEPAALDRWMERYGRLALLTEALIASLPKCDVAGCDVAGCDDPATCAFERGAGRWCHQHRIQPFFTFDEHGGRQSCLQTAPDYPRAQPLRDVRAFLEANRLKP